ncbi:MAG: type II toxin-antitoxin system VapC family toxin [Promethearchaeota archaeon]
MSGKYLLDTNIIIGLFAQEQEILVRIEKAKRIFIPSIAIGELHYGARKSTRVDENLTRINQLLAQSVILSSDEETGYWYGIVKDQLRRAGNPIPENDIWIAAITIQRNLILATRDKHFKVVDGLNIEMW